jgi:hypothetical protein
MEDFLFSREITLTKLNLPLFKPNETKLVSNKKIADSEILNKFTQITSEQEKNFLINLTLKYGKKFH